MSKITFQRRIARSCLARPAAFPGRLSLVARHDAGIVKASAKWLVRSREHTNFTYDLTPRNQEHLAWWISSLTGAPKKEIRSYLTELGSDHGLRRYLMETTSRSARWRLADRDVRYGRRAGWYAIVRALRPAHVVETGTDKGLGSCVLAAALLRNGTGQLTTIDISDDSGYLLADKYGDAATRVVGDSITALKGMSGTVDLFLHDSLHTFDHEMGELRAVEGALTERSLALSDNAHATDALLVWAESTGRRFSFFREEPAGTWYPGSGIGAAEGPN